LNVQYSDTKFVGHPFLYYSQGPSIPHHLFRSRERWFLPHEL
jgi:hypothetical protein